MLATFHQKLFELAEDNLKSVKRERSCWADDTMFQLSGCSVWYRSWTGVGREWDTRTWCCIATVLKKKEFRVEWLLLWRNWDNTFNPEKSLWQGVRLLQRNMSWFRWVQKRLLQQSEWRLRYLQGSKWSCLYEQHRWIHLYVQLWIQDVHWPYWRCPLFRY